MLKIYLLMVLGTLSIKTLSAESKINDSTEVMYKNSVERMLSNDGRLNIAGYGEVHYNQPLSSKEKLLGKLDVHRIVMFFGYNFSKKTQFVSEIEFEHVSEVWVEQAFLQHKLNKYINLRAGLMLIPMGIINEYHEPTTFNGVERPLIDYKLSMSTWREIGAGFSGNIQPLFLRYQCYLMNGLDGYNTKGTFNASSTFRNGRQKGAEAYTSSPTISSRIEYYGIRNLTIGASGYTGKSQSKLFNHLAKDDISATTKADSSRVDITMLGLDGRYKYHGLEFRGQFYYTSISNTEEYNIFTQTEGKNNDLGKAMMGYYAEVGYNVFRSIKQIEEELILFVRHEYCNTQQKTDQITIQNGKYKNIVTTAGLTLKLNKNAVIKTDFQLAKTGISNEYDKILNMGIGYMF